MLYQLLTLMVLTVTLGRPSYSEVFTSTQEVQKVFLVERNLVDALTKYLVKAETRLGRIRRYIQEYESVKIDMGWQGESDTAPTQTENRGFIESEDNDEPPVHSNSEMDSTTSQMSNSSDSKSCGLDNSNDVANSASCNLDNSNDLANGRSSKGSSLETSLSELSPQDKDALERLAGNPLHTFHLMKRLTVYWKHIDAQVLQDDWNGVLLALFGEHGPDAPHQTLPADEDLQGAAQALVRLQQVYGLNMSAMVRGEVLGLHSSAELSAQDCLYLGKHSFNLGQYPQAVEWFSEAFSLAGHESNQTISQEQVAEFLNTAVKTLEETQAQYHEQIQQQQQQQQQQHRYPQYGITENEESENITENKSQQNRGVTNENHSDGRYQEETFSSGFKYNSPYDDESNFFALCRGKKLLSAEASSHLQCRYDSRGSRYLLLMPAKVEQHHPSSAELVTFHDVLTEEEIVAMKSIANPALARAMVQGMEGKGNTVSSTRTSKVAWLDENASPMLERISRRIEYLTGLSLDQYREHSEMLQVANYGIGGHYNPHHDYLLVDKTPDELSNISPREIFMGDRVATFMFYLSDVTRGGATAFPRLGVAVWPKRGSAAFWFNLKRSGAPNVQTLHGACPVVHGSKWVSNKWIRQNGQLYTRPCGPSPAY